MLQTCCQNSGYLVILARSFFLCILRSPYKSCNCPLLLALIKPCRGHLGCAANVDTAACFCSHDVTVAVALQTRGRALVESRVFGPAEWRTEEHMKASRGDYLIFTPSY